MRFLTKTVTRRWVALVVASGLVMPAIAGCGNNSTATQGGSGTMAPVQQPAPAPQKVGLSTKQKVVLVAGAALLYYLYRKDLANNKAAAAGGANGHPQLYRSKNGGVYYRDPKNPQHVIWVTTSNQAVAVPADQLQRYAPDYQQYQGQPAPPVPAGASSVPATQYDPSLAGAGGPSGPPGPGG